MGLLIMERGGDDSRRFKEALHMAKEGIETICELADDMESQYGQRGGYGQRGSYGERGSYRYRGSYRNRDWEEEDDERSYRDNARMRRM